MCILKNLEATYEATYDINVRYICCKNADDNEAFKRLCFEYRMPITLQQNGQAERKYATRFNYMYAIMNGGKLSPFLRNNLWDEIMNTMKLLGNDLIIKSSNLSPFQQFFVRERKVF